MRFRGRWKTLLSALSFAFSLVIGASAVDAQVAGNLPEPDELFDESSEHDESAEELDTLRQEARAEISSIHSDLQELREQLLRAQLRIRTLDSDNVKQWLQPRRVRSALASLERRLSTLEATLRRLDERDDVEIVREMQIGVRDARDALVQTLDARERAEMSSALDELADRIDWIDRRTENVVI